MKYQNFAMYVVAISLSLLGCSSSDDAPALPDNAAEAVATYARIVRATYEDSLAESEKLEAAVAEFVDAPSETTLETARQAWLQAREPYLQTEVFRFYDGPIEEVEGMLNAWPLDEAYIDYVEGDADTGIVNDVERSISTKELMSLNEQGGEQNIATGYHAVEFLLWGQDLDETGPGARPFTDYVTGDEASAPNAARRAEYVTTVSGLISEHLAEVAAAWAPGKKNYRRDFEEADPAQSLGRVLTGLIELTATETGGERLQTALDSGDQEDEHSCFSDNTHRDMVQDIQGMKNVWVGSYQPLSGKKISGTGVRDVVEIVHAELASDVDAQIEKCLEIAQSLEPPFDQEINPSNEAGRKRVQNLIKALREQAQFLEEVFHVLGFSVVTPQ